jgi:hypothetical protein
MVGGWVWWWWCVVLKAGHEHYNFLENIRPAPSAASGPLRLTPIAVGDANARSVWTHTFHFDTKTRSLVGQVQSNLQVRPLFEPVWLACRLGLAFV